MDRYIRAGSNIFCAIDPRFWTFRAHIRRLEGNRRIIGTIKAFRAFLADEDTPNRIASMTEKKNRVMRRLRARRSLRGLRNFGALLGRFQGLLRQGRVSKECGAEEQRAWQAE